MNKKENKFKYMSNTALISHYEEVLHVQRELNKYHHGYGITVSPGQYAKELQEIRDEILQRMAPREEIKLPIK